MLGVRKGAPAGGSFYSLLYYTFWDLQLVHGREKHSRKLFLPGSKHEFMTLGCQGCLNVLPIEDLDCIQVVLLCYHVLLVFVFIIYVTYLVT